MRLAHGKNNFSSKPQGVALAIELQIAVIDQRTTVFNNSCDRFSELR